MGLGLELPGHSVPSCDLEVLMVTNRTTQDICTMLKQAFVSKSLTAALSLLVPTSEPTRSNSQYNASRFKPACRCGAQGVTSESCDQLPTERPERPGWHKDCPKTCRPYATQLCGTSSHTDPRLECDTTASTLAVLARSPMPLCCRLPSTRHNKNEHKCAPIALRGQESLAANGLRR